MEGMHLIGDYHLHVSPSSVTLGKYWMIHGVFFMSITTFDEMVTLHLSQSICLRRTGHWTSWAGMLCKTVFTFNIHLFILILF